MNKTAELIPLNGIELATDPLRAHSQAGADGWALLPSLPDGSPPNAVAHYARGAKRALLCRDGAKHILVTYSSRQPS